MPQGYMESPTYFSQISRQDLANVNLTHGSTLLQYVDDLLLCSPTEEANLKDRLHLLTQLAHKGHKASRDKLQFVPTQVRYLGYLLMPLPEDYCFILHTSRAYLSYHFLAPNVN